jgi:hypothetical protein
LSTCCSLNLSLLQTDEEDAFQLPDFLAVAVNLGPKQMGQQHVDDLKSTLTRPKCSAQPIGELSIKEQVDTLKEISLFLQEQDDELPRLDFANLPEAERASVK